MHIRFLILAFMLGICPAMASYPDATDAIGREFSVFVNNEGSTAASDAVSREFAVYNYNASAASPSDAVGREWGIYVGPVPTYVARQWYLGRQIILLPSVVTAKFRGEFYVESLDRAAGIKVKWNETVAVGTLVEVAGITDVDTNGERCIEASCVTPVGTDTILPLGIGPGALGGGDYFYSEELGTGQQGLYGWNWLSGSPQAVPGLNNLGLLVRTWGKVTWSDTTSFIIDDGLGYMLGDKTSPGVLVQLPIMVSPPAVDKTVAVTGISSCYKLGNLLYRLIRVRYTEDVTVLD